MLVSVLLKLVFILLNYLLLQAKLAKYSSELDALKKVVERYILELIVMYRSVPRTI